jgi:hypothetical protein
MSREMDLLRRLAEGDNRGDFFISLELLKEVEAILTLPEPIKEREVSGKIISTENAMLKEKWLSQPEPELEQEPVQL